MSHGFFPFPVKRSSPGQLWRSSAGVLARLGGNRVVETDLCCNFMRYWFLTLRYEWDSSWFHVQYWDINGIQWYTHTQTLTHTLSHTCSYIYIYICKYVYMIYVNMYICIYVYIYTNIIVIYWAGFGDKGYLGPMVLIRILHGLLLMIKSHSRETYQPSSLLWDGARVFLPAWGSLMHPDFFSLMHPDFFSLMHPDIFYSFRNVTKHWDFSCNGGSHFFPACAPWRPLRSIWGRFCTLDISCKYGSVISMKGPPWCFPC